MTASLQEKHGSIYAVVNIKVNGKRKQKWIKTDLTSKSGKRERDKVKRECIALYENNDLPLTSEILFYEYILLWLNEAKIKVDEVTFLHYQEMVNAHILPYFRNINIKLIDVNRSVLQKYFIEKYENGRIDGKGGLSSTTLKHHRNIINQTLSLAVKNNLILSNPCQYVTMPKSERYNYDFYNLDEINCLLSSIKDERLFPLYFVTISFGLRRSEVLGIKWDSIDLENKKLTIKHTIVDSYKIIEKDSTKNQSSYRSFPLNEEMINLFVKLKNDEKQNKKLFGKEYIKNDYVFKMGNGKPYSPNYITKQHAKILKKYGFRHIRFHDLRHSCASLLNAQGYTLKDIQEWLGHSDIQTTANTYAHLDTKRKENISNNICNIITSKMR